jgi:hypothetical protein
MKLTSIILAGFVLWIVNGDQPAYRRGVFASYAECVVVGQSQVDSMKSFSPNVTWQCLPDGYNPF